MVSRFIPGGNFFTNAISAGGGAIFGSGIMAIFSFLKVRKKNNEIKDLKEAIDSLEKRLGIVDEREQELMILKVSILKQLAWKDSTFDDREYKYIVRYIIKSDKLETDIKIKLIETLDEKPPLFSQVAEPIIEFISKNKFFRNDEEKYGFINTLQELGGIDSVIHKSEMKFIEKLKAMK